MIEGYLISYALSLAAGETSSFARKLSRRLARSKRVSLEDLLIASLKRAQNYHSKSYDKSGRLALDSVVRRIMGDPKPFFSAIVDTFSGDYGDFLAAADSPELIQALCQNILLKYGLLSQCDGQIPVLALVLVDAFSFFKIAFFEVVSTDEEIRVVVLQTLKISRVLEILSRVEEQLRESIGTSDVLRAEMQHLSATMRAQVATSPQVAVNLGNPFTPFSPPGVSFAGRNTEIALLLSDVDSLSRHKSFFRILTGPSGIGKTSLLYQIESHIGPNIGCVWEPLTAHTKATEFVRSIIKAMFSSATYPAARELTRTVDSLLQAYEARPAKEDCSEELVEAVFPLIRMMREVFKPTVIIIDQAERMLYLGSESAKLKPARVLRSIWSHLLDIGAPLGLILAIRKEDLAEYLRQVDSDPGGTYVWLPPLSRDESDSLLRQGFESNGKTIDNTVLGWAYEVSQGNPLSLQLIGKWLFEVSRDLALVDSSAVRATRITDIKDVSIRLMLEADTDERDLLRGLASFSATVVDRQKLQHRLGWDDPQFNSVALRLASKSLIRLTGAGLEFSSEGLKERCFEAFQDEKLTSVAESEKQLILMQRMFRYFAKRGTTSLEELRPLFDEYARCLTSIMQSSSSPKLEGHVSMLADQGFMLQYVKILERLISWAEGVQSAWGSRLRHLLYETDFTHQSFPVRRDRSEAIGALLRVTLEANDYDDLHRLYSMYVSNLEYWDLDHFGQKVADKLTEFPDQQSLVNLVKEVTLHLAEKQEFYAAQELIRRGLSRLPKGTSNSKEFRVLLADLKHQEEKAWTDTSVDLSQTRVAMFKYACAFPETEDDMPLLYGHEIAFFVEANKNRLLGVIKNSLQGEAEKSEEEADQRHLGAELVGDIDKALVDVESDGMVRIYLSAHNDMANLDTRIGFLIMSAIDKHPEVVQRWCMTMSVEIQLPDLEASQFSGGLPEVAELFSQMEQEYRRNIEAIKRNSLQVDSSGPYFTVGVDFDFQPNETLGTFVRRVKRRLRQLDEDGFTWVNYRIRVKRSL
jgi:hypothetical protein